jgi:hypothetical protein
LIHGWRLQRLEDLELGDRNTSSYRRFPGFLHCVVGGLKTLQFILVTS